MRSYKLVGQCENGHRYDHGLLKLTSQEVRLSIVNRYKSEQLKNHNEAIFNKILTILNEFYDLQGLGSKNTNNKRLPKFRRNNIILRGTLNAK